MIQKPLMKRSSYDGVARTLHWLTVFLISVQFVIGWLMDDVGRDTKVEGGIWWHLFVGGALILTIFIRVVWRVTHSPPPEVGFVVRLRTIHLLPNRLPSSELILAGPH